MKLIIGLGNPGKKYEKTRHNIWFHMLDLWHKEHGFSSWKRESKVKAEIVDIEYANERILLCKPQTYMNLSGESVAALVRFYKIETKDILVLHDEIDFPTAKIALKFWGSAAGHNGLKSMIEKLGTRDFWRIRIGVDRPTDAKRVTDRVLSSFKPEEKKQLQEAEQEIFDHIETFVHTN